MRLEKALSIQELFRSFPLQIGTTWLLVLTENVCMALTPLFTGYAIDGLLASENRNLFMLAGVLISWSILAVVRRLYDTRAYGTMRVEMGKRLDRQYPDLAISTKKARLDMGIELVDFLEEDVPVFLTAAVQIAVTLVILALFNWRFSVAAVLLSMGMLLVYLAFHKRMYRFNAGLNNQIERQVHILEARSHKHLLAHLRSLRRWKVRLSDAEALLYGGVFSFMITYIVYTLWLSTQLSHMTVGSIFSVVSYAWEYIEATEQITALLVLGPRLREITGRLKRTCE